MTLWSVDTLNDFSVYHQENFNCAKFTYHLGQEKYITFANFNTIIFAIIRPYHRTFYFDSQMIVSTDETDLPVIFSGCQHILNIKTYHVYLDMD